MKEISLPPKIEEEIKRYFKENNIPEEKQKEIRAKILDIYKKTLYEPQEAIGVITAQSLSEPSTQMTMRTYHFAGTAGIQVTLGLPRLLEIFDAKREPETPMMTIYTLKEWQTPEKIKRLAENIKEVRLKDITISTEVDISNLSIKCRLDTAKTRELGINPKELEKIIKIRNAEIEVDKEYVLAKSKKEDILSLYRLKHTLLEHHIKGIKGVTQAVITKEGEEWVIHTLGSNLAKVMEIEGVDPTRTTSNNIFEIQDVLGIEAARNAIMKQAKYTMDEQGLTVDIRYIMLLADLMTHSGQIRAIGRYGVAGQKASVLVRASFEETKKHLITAAAKGEIDLMQGIIENIMTNQVIPTGTGSFELVGDIPEIKKKKEE
ncbi:MAG: DNA-directed RNA polymerase subunit A'' [Candidatus Aenigmatarchaeota archaeon]